MEKINIEKINVLDYSTDSYTQHIHDVTTQSLKILANKINEIIDVLDKKETCESISGLHLTFLDPKKDEGKNKSQGELMNESIYKAQTIKENWEKEFDKEFGGLLFVGPIGVKEFLEEVKQFIRNLLK